MSLARTDLRVLVAGGPRTGKTTLADELLAQMRAFGLEGGAPLDVQHTDDLIGKLDWSAASLEVSTWIDKPGPWIIEGVAVPRALRKWLERSGGKPADVVYWSSTAKVPTTKAQEAMAKGCATVWEPVREELLRRGVGIRYF